MAAIIQRTFKQKQMKKQTLQTIAIVAMLLLFTLADNI
jgi:hypothetical protein